MVRWEGHGVAHPSCLGLTAFNMPKLLRAAPRQVFMDVAYLR